MIHPSYSELIQAINTNSEEDDNTMMLNSRYSLVLATSKRARQLIAGAEPLVPGAAGKKPLSVAIDEFYQGQVKILADTHEDEDEEISVNELEETSATEE
ncbi:MAG: DNA-directed RNA polymerase subunit omega [Eubacteriales bacterium]|nr:DNA-directed RNA polymerase subunit omega [Eubacteriales bacterium]